MNWETFERWLWEQERKFHLPEAARPAFERTKENLPTLRFRLENAELYCAYELDQAIDQWLATNEWPEVNNAMKYYLWLRLDAACCFALQVGGGKRTGASPLAFPVGREKELARWLLIDWWETHGRTNTVRGWILALWEQQFEEDPPPSSF